jgi:catechol 2,3-dioxygenase-like lactoylglutathione lyase family enzyme
MNRIGQEKNGKLDRRQVLQVLGGGAAALAAGSVPFTTVTAEAASTVQAAGGGMTFPVVSIQHLSLQVGDYVKSRDFYMGVLGMRDAWDNGTQCAVDFGSPGIPSGLYIRAGRGEPGVGHIAFGATNILAHLEAMKVEMERRKLANIRPDGEHGWIADDPNGYMLNTWVPAEPSHAMFPGAASPCKDAESKECHDAFQAGLGDALKAVPKPDRISFKAFAFNYVVLNCKDLAKGREFYENLMGMKVIQNKPDQVILRFGSEALVLRPAGGDGTPYLKHYAFAVENYDHAAAKAELDRLGLNPKQHTDRSWTIMDPDGMQIEVAGWGLPEHIVNAGVLL